MLNSIKKRLAILSIFLCICLYIQAQVNVQVHGKIKNFTYIKDSVKYIYTSMVDWATSENEEKAAVIKSNGSFSFSLSLERPQYIDFQYQQKKFTAFARPGSNLYISFKSNRSKQSLKFTGDDALLNNEIQRFYLAFDSFRHQERVAYNYNKQYEKVENSPELVKQLAYNELATNKKFLKDYIKLHKVSALLKSQISVNQRYSTGLGLMTYGITHSNVPDSFYSFLKDFLPDNPPAAFSPVYQMYLNAYAQYLYKKKTGPKIENYVSYLQKETSGFLRDVLFSWTMYEFLEANLLEGVQQFLPEYEKAVKNIAFKKRIRTLYEKQKNEFTAATLSKEAMLHTTPDNAGKQLFEKILEKYKGRVVYVDFWGTWCVPCIQEMPYAKKLKEELKDREVAFLYLAVKSEELTWKQVIAKLDIQGEHYLLKEDQYKLLSVMLQMKGVPHYVLVDKEGKIREKSSLWPRDPELKEKIEALLE